MGYNYGIGTETFAGATFAVNETHAEALVGYF